MDGHEAWVRGRSVSEIARLTGRDRKTLRRPLREGWPKPRKLRQVASKGESKVTARRSRWEDVTERVLLAEAWTMVEYRHCLSSRTPVLCS